jgi:2-dehydropantoate 2-reductase
VPIQTTTSVAKLRDQYDFILLTVKAPETNTAASQLATMGPALESTHIVSLQNGIGNEEILAKFFASRQVIAGTITIPIQVPEPGTIVVSKEKGGIGLAQLVAGQPVTNLAAALTEAGLPTAIYENHRAMKWSKLLLNIINNATSAILDFTPAEIVSHRGLFDIEIGAVQEGVMVMHAQNISAVKLPGYPANWLARLVTSRWLPMGAKRSILRPFMVSGRGTKMPSLHIDLAAGRSTSEVGVLNGAIVKAGQDTNIATPINQTLTEILTGLVNGQLNWTNYRHQPEKLLAEIRKSI